MAERFRGQGRLVPVTPAAKKPVHEAWADVMRDVGEIRKGDRNADQGFNFRGIDATMNTVGPVLRKHGVFVLPHGVEIIESERYETRRGAQMHGLITKHTWRVVGPAGDEFFMETLGQAADTGDKVATKAASVGYRTALLQSLTVPTGDREPDADTHERAPSVPDPRLEGWRAINTKGAHLGLTEDGMRADYLAKMGHEIDGPDATPDTLRAYYKLMGTEPAGEKPEQAEPDPWQTTLPDTA